MRNFLKQLACGVAAHHKVLWCLGGLFLLDRISKGYVQFYLTHHPVEVLPFFQLHYVENTGMAFGLMQNGNTVLIFVMLAVVAYLIKNWKEMASLGRSVQLGLVLILAGALGNLYDRIALGYVVDFLDFKVWPVFNLADSYITVGGVLLAGALLLQVKKKKEEVK